MKETRSEPNYTHRNLRGSLHEPPVKKREKKVNQPVEPVQERYFDARVNIGVLGGPFQQFVGPQDLDATNEDYPFEVQPLRKSGIKRKKKYAEDFIKGLKCFQDFFQSGKIYEKTPKTYNGEEHFDFLKKMRKACEGLQYEVASQGGVQLHQIKRFQTSSAFQDVVYLLNAGNNVLVYGFGAKGFLLPLMVRKLIWAIPNCEIYFLDYSQPFVSLKKTMVRIILHLVAIIVEKSYKNNHRKFYPTYVKLIEERSNGGDQVNVATQETKHRKFLAQIKQLYEKRTHHHVPVVSEVSSQKRQKRDIDSEEDEEQPEVSEISYSPRRMTRSSKLAEMSDATSYASEFRAYSRTGSSVIESSEEDEGDLEEVDDEEDQLNERNFWSAHQQPYLQQFAGELRRKVHSIGDMKGVLFGLINSERELLGRQVLVVNAIDVISQDDLMVGAPRVGPRLMRDETQELAVLTEIAESGLFTMLGCFQDAFFPLKIGPKVSDLFVFREVHTAELERLGEQLSMLTTKVESEIKGLGYIFKSLTQYQKQLLKLMANYQRDHNGKPITFDKLFELSLNNQLITSKKQLKEALTIPRDQKLVRESNTQNQESCYQIVCSIAALEKIYKDDLY